MTAVAEEFSDIRLLSADGRAQAAWRVHENPDFELPPLEFFNSSPCPAHAAIGDDPLCTNCGVILRRHQRTGAMWMYASGRGLVADPVGSGKTVETAAMLALCKATGELSIASRAIIVCQAAAVGQWAAELRRFLPGVQVIAAVKDPDKRLAAYLGSWEVCVISDRTFAPAGKYGERGWRPGDIDRLLEFPVGILIYDDLDAMRTIATKTFHAITRAALHVQRVHGLHGTPLQKRLPELYSFLCPVGGREVFGNQVLFRQRYVDRKPRYFYQVANVCPDDHLTLPPYTRCQTWVGGIKCGKPCHRDPTGRKAKRKIMNDAGIKENMLTDFQRRIDPLVLRRTPADMDDMDLPEVQYNPVWLELTGPQNARYKELRTGTLRRLRDTGVEITEVEAAAAFTRGAMICSGLASLDDGKDISLKLDWLMDKLVDGDFENEKVICFVNFRENVRALSRRLRRENIGHVLLWSEETSPTIREQRRVAFQTDPDIQVVIGTTTLERSLNLQAAVHLVAVDTILNAARMTQLVGRMRREGSAVHLKFFHHLLMLGTQEDAYQDILRAEQELQDSVWDEGGNTFSVPHLTPRRLMQVVATGRYAA
jgi:superfamily II DNA or RNA helicase